MRWQTTALCRNTAHDWWADDMTKQMGDLCGRCPVRLDCLMEALPRDNFEDVGVWGGTTPAQRRAIRAGRMSVESLWAQPVLS